MSRFVSIALAVLLVGSLRAQPTSSPFFPTPLGAAWNYRLGEKKLSIRVAAHEKVGPLVCAKLETVQNGAAIAVQQVTQTAAGIVRVSHDGEQVLPPVLFLKLPTVKGQSWEVDSKIDSPSGTDLIKGKFVAEEDDVKVPAGEFKKSIRVKADLTINGKSVTLTSWYAEKVGMVRQIIAIDGQDYLLELDKFVEAK